MRPIDYMRAKIPTAFIVLYAVFSSAWAEESRSLWEHHTIVDASKPAGKSGADGVRLSDADGDGLLDVAVGWEESGTVSIAFNPGPRQAGARWPNINVGFVEAIEDAVFADIDGDGANDVVSSAEGKNGAISIHWGPKGENTYRRTSQWKTNRIPVTRGRSWLFALPLDLNGDGRLDLVIGSKGKNAIVGWLENTGEPRNSASWLLHKMTDVSWVMSLRGADVDGDDDLDLLFTDRFGAQGGVFWLENPGRSLARRSWKRHRIGGRGKQVMFLDTGDINGDGVEDVVVATMEGELLLFQRNLTIEGPLWNTSILDLPFGLTYGKGVAISDVNLDGLADLVTSCECQREAEGAVSIAWLEQTVQGQWKQHRISAVGHGKYDRIEMIDLDGDGDLDLMTTEEQQDLGVLWYENPVR